jgi:hypothetical protein
MEVAVETPPTFLIPSALKILLQRIFQLRKENEILWPLTSILAFEFRILTHPMLARSTSTRLDCLYIFHVAPKPSYRTRFDVKFIRLVEIS